MKSVLKSQGFENIYVMPNGKRLAVLSENELVYPSGIPYKLCTFSRALRKKGIEDASQMEWFETLQNKFPPYVRYRGVIPFDKSVHTLKEYFALLFPTYYEGEGFAGTLLDAYSAGIPVIASDWKYNSEIVNHDVGFIYPTGNQSAFVEILKEAAINPVMLFSKKRLCLKEAEKYRIDKDIQILIKQIEGD